MDQRQNRDRDLVTVKEDNMPDTFIVDMIKDGIKFREEARANYAEFITRSQLSIDEQTGSIDELNVEIPVPVLALVHQSLPSGHGRELP